MKTKPNKRARGWEPGPVATGEREDEAFLATYDASQFERPSVTVDVALLTVADDALYTLVAPRTAPPHRGRHALPGGFVRPTESLDDAASRVLREKAGITRVYLEQLYTFGAVHRDPRTRVITVAYYALVDRERLALAETSAGAHVVARISVPWEGETGGPVAVHAGPGDDELPLAFDHAEILGMAVRRVRGKLDYTPIGFQLLPERFTLLSLQRVHETVLSRPLNKDSFRRRMLASGQLEATGEEQAGVDHRPAALYRFARRSAVLPTPLCRPTARPRREATARARSSSLCGRLRRTRRTVRKKKEKSHGRHQELRVRPSPPRRAQLARRRVQARPRDRERQRAVVLVLADDDQHRRDPHR